MTDHFLTLIKMGASLGFNARDGQWYGSFAGPMRDDFNARGLQVTVWSPQPYRALEMLHEIWVLAGSPAPRVYTPEEVAKVDAEIASFKTKP
jgi:hypothetical protein